MFAGRTGGPAHPCRSEGHHRLRGAPGCARPSTQARTTVPFTASLSDLTPCTRYAGRPDSRAGGGGRLTHAPTSRSSTPPALHRSRQVGSESAVPCVQLVRRGAYMHIGAGVACSKHQVRHTVAVALRSVRWPCVARADDERCTAAGHGGSTAESMPRHQLPPVRCGNWGYARKAEQVERGVFGQTAVRRVAGWPASSPASLVCHISRHTPSRSLVCLSPPQG